MTGRANALLHPVLVGTVLGGLVLALSVKALVLVVGGIGGMAMVLSPLVAYYVMVANIPVAIDLGGGLTATKVVFPLALASIAASVLVHRWRWRSPFQWPEGHLALFFFGLLFLSVFRFKDGPVVQIFGEAVVFAVLFFTTLAFVQDVRTLRRLVWVLIVVGMVEAVIGIAQSLLSFTLPGEYRVTAIESHLEPDQFMRVDATAVHPIVLAGFFQMVIPLSVAQLIWDRRIWARGCLVGGIALMFWGWFNTFVRTSAIAMAIMGIFALALTFRVGRYLLPVLTGGVVMVLLVFFISPDWLVEKVADTGLFGKVGNLDSLWHRVEGMVAGRDLFLDHFFFGVGYGQSDWQQVPYLPGWSVHPTGTIHNAFTEAASELGVMGLLAFVGNRGQLKIAILFNFRQALVISSPDG